MFGPMITTGIGLLAGAGVTTVVGNVIKATTPSTLRPFEKILIYIGTAVIGCATADMAYQYGKNFFNSSEENSPEEEKKMKLRLKNRKETR